MSGHDLDFYTSFGVVGNKVVVKGVKDGIKQECRYAYKPIFYTLTNEHTGWKTVDGKNVMPHECESISDYRDKIKQFENTNVSVYGSAQHAHSYIYETWPNDIKFDISKILVYYIDIEVATKGGYSEAHEATQPVTAITVYNNFTNKYIVYGCGEYKPHRDDVTYKKYDHENQLLEGFMNDWENDGPDVVTSWNGKIFDIPYLINRVARQLGLDASKKFSPWGRIREKTEWIFHNDIVVYDIAGVNQLDMLLLYKKNVLKPRESYSLDAISEIELGTKKIDYSDYQNLHDLYEKNFQLFIEYNVRDVELVVKINNKLKLLELQYYTAYACKINFEEVFSQVRVWEIDIVNFLMNKKIVTPAKRVSVKEELEGAFCMDPQIGMFDWVVSFDINSLYPSIIQCINIGAETYVHNVPKEVMAEYNDVSVESLLEEKHDNQVLIKNNMAVGANKAFYSTDQPSFYSQMLDVLAKDRKKYKSSAIQGKKNVEAIKKELASRGVLV